MEYKVVFYRNEKDLPPGIDKKELFSDGIWVYYPWRGIAVRVPDEDSYLEQRTSRNRYLITPEEQKKLRESCVGIAGLSVGSAVLESLVLSGGSKFLKLADPDIVEISNLNRMKANIFDIGLKKTVVAAYRVLELDPFANIYTWPEGLNTTNLNGFMICFPRLNVFVDEMDNLEMKLLSRFACKKFRIPVVMATDLGDKVMLDVERFDHEPDRPIFHGAVNINPEDLSGVSREGITREKWIELSNKIIGLENIPKRLAYSFTEIGKTISGIPQLGTTAQIAGAAVTFAIRQIVCGYPFLSGRYIIDQEDIFLGDFQF